MIKYARPTNPKPRAAALTALALLLLLAPPAPAGAQDSAAPKVLASLGPAYPRAAVIAGARGSVVVNVRIDGGGRVAGAHARAGHPILRKASEEAAARWRFEPARDGDGERAAVLTFDFDTEPSCDGAPSFRSPYHVEVRPAFDSLDFPDTESQIPAGFKLKNCPVHRLPLRRDKVEIIYGLVVFEHAHVEAGNRLFPFANSAAYGGCVIQMARNPCNGEDVQRSPKFAEVLYCPRCRAAEKKWTQAQAGRRG